MATIHYARLDEFWRKTEKYAFLEEQGHVGNVEWQLIAPDKHYLWLTEGMHDEFETFLPMGTEETKAGQEENSIFTLFSNGVKSNRDTWVYNYSQEQLAINIQKLIRTYNDELLRWQKTVSTSSVDDFVTNDPELISWSEGLKASLQRQIVLSYDSANLRSALYRPFTQTYLYFDKRLNERRYQTPLIFPEQATDNTVICVVNHSQIPFVALLTNRVSCIDVGGRAGQCFPFYTYAEDGSNRRENITDWALAQFQQRYPPSPITQSPLTKWDIFHYVYALLHHPDYRTKYAANLRRELPRLPFVEDFWGFAAAGAELARLHVGYESQPEYRLDFVENPAKPLDWRVERMKLNKDKTSLVYNDFLTLAGIPPQVYEYKLGNRAALEWVIDQYQVSTDKRSGIVNDPNNPADPQHIVRLIGQVITVSLATVRIVNSLPSLTIQPPQ